MARLFDSFNLDFGVYMTLEFDSQKFYLCKKHIKLQKILVIRFSSIGDIVLTTPVIRCLKHQLKAEIHMITKSAYSFISESNPNIDKVYSFRKSANEIIDKLKAENYDVIIDLQKNFRSAKACSKLDRQRFTFPKLNMEKWLLVNFKINRLPDVHIVDRYFKAVEPLCVSNDKKGLEYYIPEKDEIIPASISHLLTDDYIAMVIGGQHETKILPSKKAAEIINTLTIPCVLLGGSDDRDRGEEIIKLSDNKQIINTCGNLNLNQSASLLKQSKVVITNDTGLMHIAAAFNKFIVSIWGNTVPELGMYPYLPEYPERYSIFEIKNLKCRPCSKLGYSKCPKNHFKCMMEQDVEAIAKKVNEYLLTSIRSQIILLGAQTTNKPKAKS